MEVLAERQVAQEGCDQPDVQPPQHGEADLEGLPGQRPQRHGHGVRDDRTRDVAVPCDLEALRQQLGGDEPADHRQDHQRVPVQRQPRGLDHQPSGRTPNRWSR